MHVYFIENDSFVYFSESFIFLAYFGDTESISVHNNLLDPFWGLHCISLYECKQFISLTPLVDI